jgi:hypothetical protein
MVKRGTVACKTTDGNKERHFALEATAQACQIFNRDLQLEYEREAVLVLRAGVPWGGEDTLGLVAASPGRDDSVNELALGEHWLPGRLRERDYLILAIANCSFFNSPSK